VDGQCDKLVTVIGHQFITLTVHICVQHGGRKVPRRAGLSAAEETCIQWWETEMGLSGPNYRVNVYKIKRPHTRIW